MEINEQGTPGFLFYNAGSRIDEHWPFSISQTAAGYNPEDAEGRHSLGKFNFIAPKESWFFVPTEIQSGNEVVHVPFPGDAKRKFGARGIVMLDPRWDPAKEDPEKPLENYPVAPTRELAIERAEKLWDIFLEKVCLAHIQDVQNAMAQGNAPRAAAGFTVHALRLKNYRDPAREYFQGLKEGQTGKAPQSGTSAEVLGLVQAMQQQNQLVLSVLLAMASGQKVDPELLKQIAEPKQPPAVAVAVPAPPAVATSIRNANADDGWVKGEGSVDKGTLHIKSQPAKRDQRTAAAAKEL